MGQVKRLFREADDLGQAEPFVAAMSQIMADLRTRARDVGEPLWTLPHGHMEVRVVATRPVSLTFAVHQTAYEVVILKVNLMSPPTEAP